MTKKNKYFKLFFILGLLLVLTVGYTKPVFAYEYYNNGFEIIPKECLESQVATQQEKPCNLNSFVQLFVNLAAVGLKVLPYLAMLMIIGSGFYFVLSGGSAQRIQQGKKAFSSVIIGVLIIIVLAWGMSAMIVYLLTGEEGGFLFPGFTTGKKDYGESQYEKELIGQCLHKDHLLHRTVRKKRNSRLAGVPVYDILHAPAFLPKFQADPGSLSRLR